MSFRRWRDKTLQCKCSMRYCTASRRHCTCAIIHWTTSKQKCTWRNGMMNHCKMRIACWQDDDEVLQNKDRKDGKVWLNQMIMNNRVGEWTNRVAMERYSSYQDVCCILNLRIVLLIKPQSVIRLFCANKHSFNLTQQGIPYIYKGCSWGKCYLFRLLPNNVKVKWKSRVLKIRQSIGDK